MSYPNSYPDDPEFPEADNRLHVGPDLYTGICDYLADIVTDTARFSENEGSISLVSDKELSWSGSPDISYDSGDISFSALNVSVGLYIPSSTIATVDIDSTTTATSAESGHFLNVTAATITVSQVVRGRHQLSAMAEPADPAEGEAVIWFSNGTGYGDQGDLCMKVTHSSTTNSFTLADRSAL